MAQLKKCIYVDDLLAVTVLSCLGVLFVLVPPFNETFLRIPLALSIFFFVPGYAFIAALFPGKLELGGIERFTLSVGFSIVLTVFAGFLISLLPWGYRPGPIVISVLGMTAFFSIVALFTRKLRDESDQFSFSVKEFIKSIQSDEVDEDSGEPEETAVTTEKRRFHRSRSKVKAQGLRYRPDKGEKIPSRSPEIERALIIALVGSILISGGMLAYAKMTYEEETFTMLYLLGPDGKAEGYPTESLIDVPLNVTVGIENHELQDVNYILQMKADDEIIDELNISIKDGVTWRKDITYTREKLKTGRSKLEFALFKDKPDSSPYRSVHLYLENINSIDHIDPAKYAEVPEVENGEMELSTGWEFTSNSDSITGSYVNSSGISSSFAYGIANSYDGNLSGLPEYGAISQNIECKGDTMVLLSAYVKSSSDSSFGEASNQTKYISVNGVTVWTEEITENEDWQHVIMPISLQAGSNNLTLGLGQTYGRILPVEVFWESISFKSLADLSSYPAESNALEAVPPTSVVQPLPAYSFNKSFNVFWNGTDDSSVAYYSIDVSTDGINWQNWIQNTAHNSSVFTGEENQTYYFRSRAVDNSGNQELVHEVPDTQTKVYTGTPTIMLDISPNPCKNSTNFTVVSTFPLQAVVCLVTRDGFTPDSGELTSSDGITWTGGYVITRGDHFYVEAICTDLYGNTKSIFDEIIVENSLPNYEIKVSPKTIDIGDLEIEVTPSVALKNQPSVSISANETVNVTYLSYSDGTYYYKARISDINEGEHKISIRGYDLNSEKVEGNTSFVVDHSG